MANPASDGNGLDRAAGLDGSPKLVPILRRTGERGVEVCVWARLGSRLPVRVTCQRLRKNGDRIVVDDAFDVQDLDELARVLAEVRAWLDTWADGTSD